MYVTRTDEENQKHCEVMVIGEVIIDCFTNLIHNDVQRDQYDNPIYNVRLSHRDYKLGGAGNVLSNLSAMDVDTSIVTILGESSVEGFPLEAMQRKPRGARSANFVETDLYTTPFKHRFYDDDKEVMRMDVIERPLVNIQVCGYLGGFVLDSLSREYDLKVVVLSDYGKGFMRALLEESNMFDEWSKPIVVDARPQSFTGPLKWLPNTQCDNMFLKISGQDLWWLVNYCAKEFSPPSFSHSMFLGYTERHHEALVKECYGYLHRAFNMDLQYLWITFGKNGSVLLSVETGHTYIVPCSANQNPRNEIGCGDAAIAVIARELSITPNDFGNLDFMKATIKCASRAGELVSQTPRNFQMTDEAVSKILEMKPDDWRP